MMPCDVWLSQVGAVGKFGEATADGNPLIVLGSELPATPRWGWNDKDRLPLNGDRSFPTRLSIISDGKKILDRSIVRHHN